MSVPAPLKFTYEDYALLPAGRNLPEALKLTYDDYVLLPEDRRYEVIDGDLVGMPSQTPFHQTVVWRVTRQRRSIIGEAYLGPAPDLVAEVLLPESEARDRGPKAKRYAKFGVREMWLVDPAAKTIEILVNTEEGFRREALCGEKDTVRSVILPGFEFPAGPIFQPI